MPTQAENEAKNKELSAQQQKLRETRGLARDARKEEKQRLQGASSTKERREIKSEFGNIYDLSTNVYVPKKENEQTGKRDLQDGSDGSDFVSRKQEQEEVDSTDGYWIYYAGGTTQFIPNSDLGATPDNYSIEFSVASGAITGWSANSSATVLWDDVGDSQNEAYLPLRRGGKDVSAGGSYRETIVCVSGEPVVTLVKVG